MKISNELLDRIMKSLAFFLLSLAIPAALLCFWGFAVYFDPVLLLSAIGMTAIVYFTLNDLRTTRALERSEKA